MCADFAETVGAAVERLGKEGPVGTAKTDVGLADGEAWRIWLYRPVRALGEGDMRMTSAREDGVDGFGEKSRWYWLLFWFWRRD